MNKVSIINQNLHKRYVIEDQKDFMPQSNFKASTKGRSKSPQETLKKLIKKGLVNYTNPFLRPKSAKKQVEQKQNMKSLQMRHTQFSSSATKVFAQTKCHTSSSMFMCSRNHGTNQKNLSSKYRVRTQQGQNNHSQSSFLYKKSNKSDWDDFFPLGNQVFREFRNISEQSMSRINVENERRNFKLNQFQKSKYDETWKKYPVPPTSKDKHSIIYKNTFFK